MTSVNDPPYLEGFATIPREIQRDTSISWKAKLVYLSLSSRAGAKLVCWPSMETIAEESSCSVSSVQRALEELRSLGVVSWKPGVAQGGEGRPPNVYHLGTTLSIRSDRTETSEFPVTQTGVSGQSDQGMIQGNDSSKRTSTDLPFEAFYRAYPRHISKGTAFRAWKSAIKKEDASKITEAAKAYAASVAGKDPNFLPYPSSWLNGERWADEPDRVESVRPRGMPSTW